MDEKQQTCVGPNVIGAFIFGQTTLFQKGSKYGTEYYFQNPMMVL